MMSVPSSGPVASDPASESVSVDAPAKKADLRAYSFSFRYSSTSWYRKCTFEISLVFSANLSLFIQPDVARD
jgi:hypothetical protein